MTLNQALRYAGMFALACTGIGAIYLLARTIWVRPNTVAIIDNYSTREKEMLNAGVHVILNPFCNYVNEISTQTQVTSLNAFASKSLDNVDAIVKADFTYEIVDPQLFSNKLATPMQTLTETVKAAFSSAIQTLDFKDVTSAEINALAQKGGHNEDTLLQPSTQLMSSTQQSISLLNNNRNSRSVEDKEVDDRRSVEEKAFDDKDTKHKAEMAEHGSTFFRRLMDMCSAWGVKIINFRIISIEAKHPGVSEALESIAKTRVQAEARRRAAMAKADTQVTLANGQKKVQLIRAEAVKETAEKMGIPPGEVYEREAQVRIAEQLGKGGNLLLNAGSLPLFATSSAVSKGVTPVVTVPQRRPSLSNTG